MALLAIVSLVLFVASGQLLAADEAGAEGKGLLTPEFEIFIYTIVVFLIAFLILQKKAWGPIAAALDERESKIRESLEAADRMRQEQQEFQAEQEKLLAEARKEASAIVAEGKRDAEVVRDQVVTDAKTQAEEIKNRALADIDQAKEKAVDEIHTHAVGLSISIAEKLIGHAVNKDDQERIAKDTISEYEKIG
ncbi:MAG: F0F1 ATP synthase subunit B [Planctomycetota bacterium]|nr:F0F1 ATP synthase subunit B [Planctomycetota bacterium]